MIKDLLYLKNKLIRSAMMYWFLFLFSKLRNFFLNLKLIKIFKKF